MIGQKKASPTSRKCTIIPRCPAVERIRKSKIGVKYSAYRLAMNSGIVKPGWVKTRRTRLCSTATSSSRGPFRPRPAEGRARSVSVTGAPSSSRIGASMLMIMCCTMWTLKSTIPYSLSAVHIVTPTLSTPRAHATVRGRGHASPRLRSRTTPAAYSVSARRHPTRKNGSPVNSRPRPSVNGGRSIVVPCPPWSISVLS
jgi:hypothetical protein